MNKIKTKKGEWFIQKKSAHLPEKESAMSLQIYICPVFILLEVGWNYVQPVFILLEVGWKDIQTNIIVHYKGTVSVEKCKNIIDTLFNTLVLFWYHTKYYNKANNCA